MGTREGDALTIQVDHGEHKAVYTCTGDSIAVRLTGVRDTVIANYLVVRSDVPRMDLLLSGIEAWSKELFIRTLAERGEIIAPLQQDKSPSTD